MWRPSGSRSGTRSGSFGPTDAETSFRSPDVRSAGSGRPVLVRDAEPVPGSWRRHRLGPAAADRRGHGHDGPAHERAGADDAIPLGRLPRLGRRPVRGRLGRPGPHQPGRDEPPGADRPGPELVDPDLGAGEPPGDRAPADRGPRGADPARRVPDRGRDARGPGRRRRPRAHAAGGSSSPSCTAAGSVGPSCSWAQAVQAVFAAIVAFPLGLLIGMGLAALASRANGPGPPRGHLPDRPESGRSAARADRGGSRCPDPAGALDPVRLANGPRGTARGLAGGSPAPGSRPRRAVRDPARHLRVPPAPDEHAARGRLGRARPVDPRRADAPAVRQLVPRPAIAPARVPGTGRSDRALTTSRATSRGVASGARPGPGSPPPCCSCSRWDCSSSRRRTARSCCGTIGTPRTRRSAQTADPRHPTGRCPGRPGRDAAAYDPGRADRASP